MDKLRKIGAWFWRNKERMVLMVAVIALCGQVYRFVFKKPEDGEDNGALLHLPPRRDLPQGFEGPGSPPPADFRVADRDFTGLYRHNPMWVYGKPVERETSPEQEASDITLLAIRPWRDGTYRAEIKTKARRLYKVGDKFETYEVVSIDPDAGTVEILSTRLGRRIMLRIGE